MLLGTDDIKILRGSVFKGTWQWQNEDTEEYENFAGLTATIKIKNIDEEFANVQNTFIVGTAIVEPPDANQVPFKGRIDITIPKVDTLKLAIPSNEEDKYGESGVYSILSITLSTGEVILQAKVTVVESLESEIFDYIQNNQNEVLAIVSKIDDFNADYSEVTTLISNIINTIAPNITAINSSVQANKDAVESLKIAVETIFDNFDDRYLGVKASNPTLDNDGNVLQIGAIYYNSVTKELRFFNGTEWDSPSGAAQTYALQASQSATTATAKAEEVNTKTLQFNSDYNTFLLLYTNHSAGVYTPSFASSGLATVTANLSECRWSKIGNIVTVSGVINLSTASVSLTSTFILTLPVLPSSYFATKGKASGILCGSDNGNIASNIYAKINDSAVVCYFKPTTANTATDYSFSFTYQV